MKRTLLFCTTASLLISAGCTSRPAQQTGITAESTHYAVQHHTMQVKQFEETGKVYNPRTIDKDGNVQYIPIEDWTSGFFPGSLWYTYSLTGDKKWRDLAEVYTESLDSVKYITWHHDVGFMIGCSYLNGLRLTGKEEYKDVIAEAARSLSTRFRPAAGILQSWDTHDWTIQKGWMCPVIIDNMMNLELLFEAAIISGDRSLYDIAVSHADITLRNHFRGDNSSYHVVDYDPSTGQVRGKETWQGHADGSAWSRGQAWGLYGYTMCYRYTKNPDYLEQAQKIYGFIFGHENLPKDLIPYWDYHAPNIPDEPRDVSAAACAAAALYELSTYVPYAGYKEKADEILSNLSTDRYRAEPGTNGNFILKHSVGARPHNVEVDVPLNYADYYFLEAVVRKKELES